MSKVEEVTQEEPKEQTENTEEHSHEHEEHAHGQTKHNKGEKKARKIMQKLGLKPVPGVSRVTMKRAKNMLFIVDEAEVMKSPNADIYIVFGQARFEDLNQVAASKEVEKLKEEKAKEAEAKVETIKEEEEEEEGEIDESGLNPDDITNVMDHCKVSRAKAVKALKESGGDSVDAILKLS